MSSKARRRRSGQGRSTDRRQRTLDAIDCRATLQRARGRPVLCHPSVSACSSVRPLPELRGHSHCWLGASHVSRSGKRGSEGSLGLAVASLQPRFSRAGAGARAPRREAARRAASGRPGAHPMAFKGQCACGAKRSAHSALPCRGSPREGAVGKGRGRRARWRPRGRPRLATVATPPPFAGHKHPGPSLHNDRYVKAGAPRASVRACDSLHAA